jgi:hypothetical protein
VSNADRSIDDLLALERSCTTCAVRRGEWCQIRAGYKGEGEPAQFLHVERTRATRHAHWVGYTRGQLEALEMVRYRIRDQHVGELEIHDIVDELHQQAERWAQSAHQRALEDIPEGWHR